MYLNFILVFCLPSILFSSEEIRTFYPFKVQGNKVHPALQATAVEAQSSISVIPTQHRLPQSQAPEEPQPRSENQPAESNEFTPFGYLFDTPTEPEANHAHQSLEVEEVARREACYLVFCCCKCNRENSSEEVNR